MDLIPLNTEDFQNLARPCPSGENDNPASGQEIIAPIIYKISRNFIKMGMA